MRNTKMKQLGTLAIITFFSFACNKENVEQEDNNEQLVKREVIHNYEYNGSKYHITYLMDKDDYMIGMRGDLQKHSNIFNNEDKDQIPSVFWVDAIDENSGAYSIHVFDSSQEMDQYQERTTGVTIPKPNGDRIDCTNSEVIGSDYFYFYRDVNWTNQIHSLTQLNVSYFQDQWLNHPSENDAISSFKKSNSSSVDLFRDNCFFGTQIRFSVDISNLHDIYVSTSPYVDYTAIDFYWDLDGKHTNYHFGDQASSIKGWSL